MRRTARRRFRGIARALVVLIVAVGGFALYTVYLAGAFKTIEPHFEGSCRRVVGIVGAEDMALAADGRHVFLSADDRRQTRAGHPVPGGIWLYDLESEALPLNVTPQAGPDFHPHGIALWNDPAGGGRLFVVNHPDEGRMGDGEGRQTVEVFDWVEGGLVHTITLADPLLRSPNGIAATGPDSFYVSNDHGLSGKLRQVEDWLRLARSNVIYFDGHGFRQAAGGISFANGIAVSADGRKLYVASTTGLALLAFDRDPESGALGNRRDVSLGTAPDNVKLGDDGALWIGAHPKLLDFLGHAKDAAKPSPSQVLRILPEVNGGYGVNEVFLDDGKLLSGSSVAVACGKRMLVGPVFEDHFLDCTMK